MLLTQEYLKANMHMKDEEIRRAHLVAEAREQAQQSRNGRRWRWQIEPGMEDAFQELQGWLLSSQRGADVETTSAPPRSRAGPPHEPCPPSKPLPLRLLQRLVTG